jgi:aryl-alcohol dehydrogenase-like predicted oxidoreductase
MHYRYMGKTGLKVSELCLGAMTFGREDHDAVCLMENAQSRTHVCSDTLVLALLEAGA